VCKTRPNVPAGTFQKANRAIELKIERMFLQEHFVVIVYEAVARISGG